MGLKNLLDAENKIDRLAEPILTERRTKADRSPLPFGKSPRPIAASPRIDNFQFASQVSGRASVPAISNSGAKTQHNFTRVAASKSFIQNA